MTPPLRAGIQAADAVLLDVFGVRVAKTLDPMDDNDFLVIIHDLTQAIRGQVGPAEAAALRKALDILDIDWANASEAAKDRVVLAARAALVKPPVAWPAVDALLDKASSRVVKAVRGRMGMELGAKVALDLSATDKKVSNYAARAASSYVRDAYGARADAASSLARRVVAAGLDKGLGREELGKQLAQQLGAQGLARQQSYYNMVASAHIGRARVYGSLASYNEAGITEYRFIAIRDELTTEQCRFMHGRTFKVTTGLQKLVEASELDEPSALKDVTPWMSSGKNEDGQPILYVKNGAGERQTIAQIDKSAMGQKDQSGSFTTDHSNESLAAMGLAAPPLHGNCRSTTIPVT